MRRRSSTAAAYLWLVVLVLATISAQLDRHLIGLLLIPIRHEFAITDTQVSLLQGMAFAIFYSVMGLYFGRWVDRGNRRNILVTGLLAWSVMAICSGLAQNYWQLFASRLGVGFGEACLAPAAYSLITDQFHRGQHGRALAIFTLSSAVGGGLSIMSGAIVLGALQAHPAFALPWVGQMEPWRNTFIIIALPGLAVAVLMLTLRDASRAGAADLATPADRHSALSLREYFSSAGRAFAHVTAANCLMSMIAIGSVTWSATFFVRTHGVTLAQIGRIIGLIVIAAAVVGGLVGGWLADSALVARRRGQKFWAAWISVLLTIPMALAWPLWPDTNGALVVFFVATTVFNSALCCSPAVLQDIVPKAIKGRASALYWLFVGLVGYGLGPTSIAFVTDYVFKNDRMLQYSLVVVPGVVLMIAVLVIWSGLRPYEQARLWVAQDAAQSFPRGETATVRGLSALENGQP